MYRRNWYVYLELAREVPVLPTVQVRKAKSSDLRKHYLKVSEILIQQILMQEKDSPKRLSSNLVSIRNTLEFNSK